MADGTHIQWTDATWSPVTGCTRVSEGCDRCYIERTVPFRVNHRKFDAPGVGGTTGVKLHSERLGQPQKWRKPRLIFVCSMADLFHDDVPDRFIADVFAVMAIARQHTYQVLTKRPARMRSLLSSRRFREQVQRAALVRMGSKAPWLVEPWWPLANVWCGVSVETQKWADIRIPILLETPAAVRWISAEPLLGPIDLHAKDTRTFGPRWLPAVAYGVNAPNQCAGDGSRIGGLYATMYGPNIDWVVVGGETGPGPRTTQVEWSRTLRDQCVDAGVAFFYKQHGQMVSIDQLPDDTVRELDAVVNLGQPHPEYVRIANKKRAGRTLDGREWNEYPEDRS